MRAGIVGGKRALTAALRSVVIELANVHLDAEDGHQRIRQPIGNDERGRYPYLDK